MQRYKILGWRSSRIHGSLLGTGMREQRDALLAEGMERGYLGQLGAKKPVFPIIS